MKIFWRWVQRQKESFDIFEKLIKAISSTSRDVTNYSVNLLAPTLQKSHVPQLEIYFLLNYLWTWKIRKSRFLGLQNFY